MRANYGGRAEIAGTVCSVTRKAAEGRLKPGAVNEETIQRHLYIPVMPDVDLFIRTSGELRASDFLMWEPAYAELYFSNLVWPDFGRWELWKACEAYAERDRCFGDAQDKIPRA